MFSKYFQTHLACYQFHLFRATSLGPSHWLWPGQVASGPGVQLSSRDPSPSARAFLAPLSLRLELLISGPHVFLFLRLLFILERGKEDMGGGFLFVLIICALFNLPSSTGILSFMSEMMQLKFRNIKQLGSCRLSEHPSHCFLIYFPFWVISCLRRRAKSILFPFVCPVAGPS